MDCPIVCNSKAPDQVFWVFFVVVFFNRKVLIFFFVLHENIIFL